MSKKEELLQTYMKDVDSTSSKQKFGFFSMPASAFAGSTTFEQKTGTNKINIQFIKMTMAKSRHSKEISSLVSAPVEY